MSRLRKELFSADLTIDSDDMDMGDQSGGALAPGAPFLDAIGAFGLALLVYALYLAYTCNQHFNPIEFLAALCCPCLYVPFAIFVKKCSGFKTVSWEKTILILLAVLVVCIILTVVFVVLRSFFADPFLDEVATDLGLAAKKDDDKNKENEKNATPAAPAPTTPEKK